jgi:hypothetical protein
MWRILFFAACGVAGATDPPDFARHVLPIFEKYCLGCHAAGMRMGSFECDTYEGVMRGANYGPVVEPGRADDSRLYQSLSGRLSPRMPLGQDELSSRELAVIRDWINAGAKPPKPPPRERVQ